MRESKGGKKTFSYYSIHLWCKGWKSATPSPHYLSFSLSHLRSVFLSSVFRVVLLTVNAYFPTPPSSNALWSKEVFGPVLVLTTLTYSWQQVQGGAQASAGWKKKRTWRERIFDRGKELGERVRERDRKREREEGRNVQGQFLWNMSLQVMGRGERERKHPGRNENTTS